MAAPRSGAPLPRAWLAGLLAGLAQPGVGLRARTTCTHNFAAVLLKATAPTRLERAAPRASPTSLLYDGILLHFWCDKIFMACCTDEARANSCRIHRPTHRISRVIPPPRCTQTFCSQRFNAFKKKLKLERCVCSPGKTTVVVRTSR